MLNNYTVSFRNKTRLSTMNVMARSASEAYWFIRQLYSTCVIYAVTEYLVMGDGSIDAKKTPIREPFYFNDLSPM